MRGVQTDKIIVVSTAVAVGVGLVTQVIVAATAKANRRWGKRLRSCEQVWVVKVDVHKTSVVAAVDRPRCIVHIRLTNCPIVQAE